jgi:HlyD family secretion protein
MIQSQKIEIIGKRLRLRPLLIGGVVLLLAGGAYSIWRSQTPSTSAVQPETAPRMKTITALGYLKPRGEVIKLSAPNSGGGANRVEQLLVKRGEAVKAGQVIAVLDSRDRLQVSLVQAQKQVGVSRSNLAVVKAGAKGGTVDAQKFEIARVKAQFLGEERGQRETVDRVIDQIYQPINNGVY